MVKDGLMWNMDLKPHASGKFSMAVVQANSDLEDQIQVFTSDSSTVEGIYDGHGGPEASCFANQYLIPLLHKIALEQGQISTDAMQQAFSKTEAEFLKAVSRTTMPFPRHLASVGSCCLVGAITSDVLYVANLGDSRAVLGRIEFSNRNKNVVAERLTTDHNVSVEVQALHPHDSNIVGDGAWRIKGIIQVPRSIGDFYLKKTAVFPHTIPLRQPVITAEPSILERKIQHQDVFVIFATHSLWEYLSDQTAVEIVTKNPRAGIANHYWKFRL